MSKRRETPSASAPRQPRGLALAAAIALATPSASAFTINPSGGNASADGLRIELAPNTQVQVWRQGVAQASSTTAPLPSSAVRNSVYLAVGSRVYGATCGVTPWTPVSQSSITGVGTSDDPWRGTTVVRAGERGPVLTIETRYALPEDSLTQRITVDIADGSTEPVRLYHLFDTSFAGSTDAPALMGPGSTPSSVGALANGSYSAFASPSPAWSDWLSSRADLAFESVARGADLARSVDLRPTTDNALGAQWNLGATGHYVVSYRMVFTAKAPCATDLDCGTQGFCDTSEGLCVGCVVDANCGGTTPVCDTIMHACIAVGDTDADGDGATDAIELAAHTNPAAADSDLDTVPDGIELGTVPSRPLDTDGDGLINALDPDDDNDGILTRDENPLTQWGDSDGDDLPDYLDADDDDDGISTRDERPSGLDRDTDGNGVPDHLEADDDHDGILTRLEVSLDPSTGDDIDGDNVPSYRDTDSDNDGAADFDEFGIGVPRDSDRDGLPDFLDSRDDTVVPDASTDAASDASTDAASDASTDAASDASVEPPAPPPVGGWSCTANHTTSGGSDATGAALLGLALCAIAARRRAR